MEQRHRCKMHSAEDAITFTENIEGINEWPHSWPDGEISYRLNNFAGDISKENHQHRTITVSLRAWSAGR